MERCGYLRQRRLWWTLRFWYKRKVNVPWPQAYEQHWSQLNLLSVLVGGPYLVRTASIEGETLTLVRRLKLFNEYNQNIYSFQTGDLNGATNVEVIAPNSVSKITWNGKPQQLQKTARNSLAFAVGSSAPSVALPALDNWKVIDRCVDVISLS